MEITSDHPVYVEGKGWLWVENLAVGDRLRRSDGGVAKVLAVERVKLAEPEPVYNFTVKGPHTYFVLEVGVLVHNSDFKCGWVSDEGNTTLYRFAEHKEYLKSRLAHSSRPELKPILQQDFASWDLDQLADIAEAHAKGQFDRGLIHVDNSPYFSTLSDLRRGYLSTDDTENGLQSIIYGQAYFQVPLLNRPAADYIFELSVPNKLLYRPYNSLSRRETEVLVFDVWNFDTANYRLKAIDITGVPTTLEPTRVWRNPMYDVDYHQRIEIKGKLRQLLTEEGNENLGPEDIISIIKDLKKP